MPSDTYALAIRLRKSKTDGPQPVQLIFTADRHETRIAAGISVDPRAWDGKKRRINPKKSGLHPTHAKDNAALDGHEQFIRETAERLRLDGELVTAAAIKEAFAARLKGVAPRERHAAPDQLVAYWKTLARTRPDLTDSSRQVYRASLEHVVAFDKRVTWQSIDGKWLRGFVAYMEREGKGHNTISKTVKTLKTVMSYGREDRLHDSGEHTRKAFRVTFRRGDGIALTDAQLDSIAAVDLSDRPGLANARDLFLIQTWTAARYSDLVKLGPQNLVERDGHRILTYTPQKTVKAGTVASIPVHPTIAHLVTSEAATWPQAISNPKLNKYVKLVAERAGLTEVVERNGCDPARACDLVVTSSGRRSFATYMDRHNVPLATLMAMTGHKTEKALRIYLRGTSMDKALDAAALPIFQSRGHGG